MIDRPYCLRYFKWLLYPVFFQLTGTHSSSNLCLPFPSYWNSFHSILPFVSPFYSMFLNTKDSKTLQLTHLIRFSMRHKRETTTLSQRRPTKCFHDISLNRLQTIVNLRTRRWRFSWPPCAELSRVAALQLTYFFCWRLKWIYNDLSFCWATVWRAAGRCWLEQGKGSYVW